VSSVIYEGWYQKGTPEEIAGQLADAIAYVRAEPSLNEAQSVLIFAWNEFDEGGWICPNLPSYGGTERLDAIAGVLV